MQTTQEKPIPLAYSLLSAGDAIEIDDDGYGQLDINCLITSGRSGWIAYRVTGDSMLTEIKPGSIVFVDTMRQAKDGDIVVCNISGANCIKVLERRASRLFLVPKNDEYPAREIRPYEPFNVLGVVVYFLGTVSPYI